MKNIIYFIGGGFLGWYLGTQKEERPREVVSKLRSELRELQLQLKESQKPQVISEEPIDYIDEVDEEIG